LTQENNKYKEILTKKKIKLDDSCEIDKTLEYKSHKGSLELY